MRAPSVQHEGFSIPLDIKNTRITMPGPSFSQTPLGNTLQSSPQRVMYAEVVISQPVYAWALGPRCTFDEVVISKRGEVDSARYIYGPLRHAGAAVVSTGRPVIDYFEAGTYLIYMSKPMPNDGWYGNEIFGENWIATGTGNDAGHPIVVTDTEKTPVAILDIIGYHMPVAIETLPLLRAAHEFRFRYSQLNVTGIVTGWSTLWALNAQKTFRFHTQGRKKVFFHFQDVDPDFAAQWAIDVYGITAMDAGYGVSSLKTTSLFSFAAAMQPNLVSMAFDNAFDGYQVDVTRTISNEGDFCMRMRATD